MKANEVPEKIYVPTTGDELHYHMACPNNEFQESIEYTRTDAFIEKAWDWIEDNLLSSNQQDKSRFYYEQFKKYMEE